VADQQYVKRAPDFAARRADTFFIADIPRPPTRPRAFFAVTTWVIWQQISRMVRSPASQRSTDCGKLGGGGGGGLFFAGWWRHTSHFARGKWDQDRWDQSFRSGPLAGGRPLEAWLGLYHKFNVREFPKDA